MNVQPDHKKSTALTGGPASRLKQLPTIYYTSILETAIILLLDNDRNNVKHALQ